MANIIKVIRVLCVALCFGSSAYASVIFDNGPYTATARTVQLALLADDFQFAQAMTVEAGSFVAYGDGLPWDGTLDYFILADNGGNPGAVLASGGGTNVQRISLGSTNSFYGDYYQYSFQLDNPFAADANTNYWLAWHVNESYNYLGSSIYSTYSHFRDGIGNARVSPGGTMDNWFDAEGDFHFQLSGAATVPVPAAFWLFGSAVGVMACLRRKAAA